jgi:hypothetical protein
MDIADAHGRRTVRRPENGVIHQAELAGHSFAFTVPVDVRAGDALHFDFSTLPPTVVLVTELGERRELTVTITPAPAG